MLCRFISWHQILFTFWMWTLAPTSDRHCRDITETMAALTPARLRCGEQHLHAQRAGRPSVLPARRCMRVRADLKVFVIALHLVIPSLNAFAFSECIHTCCHALPISVCCSCYKLITLVYAGSKERAMQGRAFPFGHSIVDWLYICRTRCAAPSRLRR